MLITEGINWRQFSKSFLKFVQKTNMKILFTLVLSVFSTALFAGNKHCLLSANFYVDNVQTLEIDCPQDQATEDDFHAQKFTTLAEALDFISDHGYEIQVIAPHDISHAIHKFIMGYSVVFKKEKVE